MSKALEIEHKSFLDALSYQSLLSFKLDGRQHPVPDMLTDRVVEHLDRSRPSMWCNFGAGHRAAFSGGLGCNL